MEHDPKFTFLAEIASEYEVHPNQITKWKKKVVEDLPDVFSCRQERKDLQSKELVQPSTISCPVSGYNVWDRKSWDPESLDG